MAGIVEQRHNQLAVFPSQFAALKLVRVLNLSRAIGRLALPELGYEMQTFGLDKQYINRLSVYTESLSDRWGARGGEPNSSLRWL